MISLLYFIIYFLLFLVLGILAFILIYHFKDIIHEKRLENKSEKWQKPLSKYLNDEITLKTISEKLPRDYHYLYDFFKPYLKNLDEKDFYKLKMLIQKIEMDEFYLKKLKKGNRKKKIKAAVFLGKIKEKMALPLLKRYIHKGDELIRNASMWAIAEIGEINLYSDVLKVVLNNTSMTFEALTELSIHFGRDICFTVKELLEEYLRGEREFEKEFGINDHAIIALFIDVLGYYRFKRSKGILKRILTGDKKYYNDEVLIHIFKTLVKIEVSLNVDLNKFLDHSNWVIRSQTARYVGKIKDGNYSDELISLLNDEKWWVRYYAAEALFKIGKKDLLKEISKTDQKRAEISNYVIDLHN
ncbi:MAG: HEAT repeat domain-containing protein [Bacillota bacterium]